MQNKPNFQDAQMNVSNIITRNYENKWQRRVRKNKPNTNPNKPNLRKAKMNINSIITKDYRKKDDFLVRINKPNSRKAKNERKIICYRGLQKKMISQSKKTNPIQTQFPSRNAGRINRRVFYFDSLCGFGYSIGCFVT